MKKRKDTLWKKHEEDNAAILDNAAIAKLKILAWTAQVNVRNK